MFINRIACLVFFAFALMLSGCSNLRSGAKTGANGAVGAGSANGVLTQGYGENAGISGQDLADAYKLKAPFNQIYYFDFDKDDIQLPDQKSMIVQANYLISHPNAKIRLEGNTDERGSREYNIALGWRRAKAVAQVLKEQGVNPSQIDMISYGEEKPIAFEHNESAWHLNRRVVLVYEAE